MAARHRPATPAQRRFIQSCRDQGTWQAYANALDWFRRLPFDEARRRVEQEFAVVDQRMKTTRDQQQTKESLHHEQTRNL